MEYTYRQVLSFKDYMSRVFTYTALGLSLSAFVAWVFTDNYYELVYHFGYQKIALISMVSLIAELVLALVFSAGLQKMETKTAWFCYGAYCVCTGLSLSAVLMAYTAASVVMALVMTALVFGSLAIIGHNTQVDVTKFSSLLFTSLSVIVIGSLLNMLFFHSSGFDLLLCYVSIIVFMGLIVYDVRRLRAYYEAGCYDEVLAEKYMLFGAFQLYLDFINLFLRILQLFGRRKD